jgi:hypothetical protein
MNGQRPTLTDLMRAVAGLGLMLAASTSVPDGRALFGVAGVGLGLWAFDLLRAPVPEDDDAVRGRGVVIAPLAAMLALELAAAALSASRGDEDLTLFYGASAAFQVAALATTARCGPDDMSLVAWGSCHGAISFAAAVILLAAAGLMAAGRSPDELASLLAVGLRVMTTLSLLFLIAAFLLLLAALALGLLQERDRRRRAWMSLILAQTAILVLFLRWPWSRP